MALRIGQGKSTISRTPIYDTLPSLLKPELEVCSREQTRDLWRLVFDPPIGAQYDQSVS